MFRAVIAGVVVLGAGPVLVGCSGGGVHARAASAACPLLAELGQTGQTVARADVSDPDSFNRALHEATAQYVRTARKLRGALPPSLRPDVDRMIAAAQHQRYADAGAAGNRVFAYARTVCKT